MAYRSRTTDFVRNEVDALCWVWNVERGQFIMNEPLLKIVDLKALRQQNADDVFKQLFDDKQLSDFLGNIDKFVQDFSLPTLSFIINCRSKILKEIKFECQAYLMCHDGKKPMIIYGIMKIVGLAIDTRQSIHKLKTQKKQINNNCSICNVNYFDNVFLLLEQKKHAIQLAYTLSHQIRSYTANIQALIHLLKLADNSKEEEQCKTYLNEVSEKLSFTIDHMNDILNM